MAVKIKDRKPKVSPQPKPVATKGIVSGTKLALVEVDKNGVERIVPEDVVRVPGKVYFYRQEANNA